MSAIEKRIECLEAKMARIVAGSNSVFAGWVETLTPDECSFLLGALRRQEELGDDRFEATMTEDERARWLSLIARFRAFL